MPAKNTDLAIKKDNAMQETKVKEDEAWYQIRPTYYSNFDTSAGEFECEVHLPGVGKDDVKLRVLPELFDLKAKREHVLFTLTEYFPCECDINSLDAKYENGLLRLRAKIRNPLESAVDIPLQ